MVTPPQAPEAEKAVLGSCIIDAHAACRAGMLLYPEDFYFEANRTVYSVMVKMMEDGLPIDLPSLHTRLTEFRQLDEIGGMPALTALTDSVGTTAHVEYYAKLVKGASFRRQILVQIKQAETEVLAGNYPDPVIQELGALILAGSGNMARKLFDMREDLQAVINEIITRKKPLNTGFPWLDHKLGGVLPSELVTVGGRTSVGKTAFMLRTCLQMAMESQQCLYITSEMRIVDLVARMLPQATNVPAHKIRSKLLTPEDVKRIWGMGMENLSSLPIHLLDRPRISLRDIKAAVVRSGCQVVFVDHLQRCQMPKAEKESSALYDLMAGFKELLLDTGVVGFMGCQLDRERDTRPSQRPLLRDFRGSSGIESESNICLLLWRPNAEYVQKKPGSVPPAQGTIRVECVIAKQREGPAGVGIDMDFNGDLVKFIESEIGNPDASEEWQ